MVSFTISWGTILVVTTRMKIDDGCTLSGMVALMILTRPNGGVRRFYGRITMQKNSKAEAAPTPVVSAPGQEGTVFPVLCAGNAVAPGLTSPTRLHKQYTLLYLWVRTV